MKNRSSNLGFTLVEVLASLIIFALVSAAAYGAMQQVLQSENIVKEANEDFQELLLAMRILERDAFNIIERIPRNRINQELDSDPAKSIELNGSKLKFSASSFDGIARIEYRLENSKLLRTKWVFVDHTSAQQPSEQTLLAGINRVQWRIRDSQGKWHASWPVKKSEDEDEDELIEARLLELNFRHTIWGEVRRLHVIN